MLIVHIARIRLDYKSGMGRISSMWKNAFQRMGYDFLHIGMDEVPQDVHPNLWGLYVRNYIKKMNIHPDIVLVHEPYGGFFLSNFYKTVVFSHGIEERAWLEQKRYNFQSRTLKSYLLPYRLRFFANNRGLKYAHLLLLSNETDKRYLDKKGVTIPMKQVFKNGYYSFGDVMTLDRTNHTILFNGTWIERKGVNIIYQVFNKLLSAHPAIRLILAGTAFDEKYIIAGFHCDVRDQISIIPTFTEEEEAGLYSQSSIFILPSYFEGQSLALTQAMAMGLCPVVSDNSGQIDFVKHQENGLVFETGNAESLYKQLIFLIENEHLIQQYGNKARQSVADLEWDKVAEEVVRTVVSIC